MFENIAAGRILALDVGDKRVGLALSDEEAFLATGLPTLMRGNLAQDIQYIARLVMERQVSAVVVGLPYNMDGTEGPQAKKVKGFQEALAQQLAIPVVAWDERLTTVEAERYLLNADLSRKKRRKAVDRLSAEIILQAFLDYLASQKASRAIEE